MERNEIFYYINKENGTTVAKLTGLQQESLNLLHASPIGFFLNIYEMRGIVSAYPDSLIGKSTCIEQDIFNEDAGCKLSKLKLIVKAERNRLRIAERGYEVIRKKLIDCYEYLGKAEARYENALDELVSFEENL